MINSVAEFSNDEPFVPSTNTTLVHQNAPSVEIFCKINLPYNTNISTLTDKTALQLDDSEANTATSSALFHKYLEIPSMAAKVSGSVDLTVSWGDKDGPKISGGLTFGAEDSKGNGVEATVSQSSDGQGKATVSASAKSSDKKK